MSWTTAPLKRQVDPTRPITYGIVQAGPDTPGGVPYIRPADMTQTRGVTDPESLPRTTREIAETYRRSTVAEGDIVVSIGPSFGKVMIVPAGLAEANLTQGTARLAPIASSSGRYLYWALQAATTRQFWEASVGGATFRALNLEPLARTPVPLPPLGEQRRIATFLDSEVASIETLAQARYRQLALLEERSQALVFDVVRGLREPWPRIDSGLDWLGDIPSSWPTMPVGYQFEVLLGKMLNQENIRGLHLAPYIRNANVQWDRVATDDLLYMNFPPNERQRYAVLPGDLLVCEGGEPGRAAIWDGRVREIYYQKALHRVRARGYSSPRWLFYCLRAATSQNVFAVEGNSTTIAHLTGEQLRAHRFPFPDRETQDRLTATLDADALKHTRLTELLGRQLNLLTERRQALITAAVTGQFDVSTASGRNVTEGITV
ncbi:restriction endonuclease subunit S [Streptomyces hygroscopicus]|uniref:restriction endonuclease subunit S n=1 Tax=Streptomyces hygroscopicus TaxID=1912 RepID=UPI00204F6792|nr:restriction endonuclease subunit S [Streptomyces hygroscopicus]BDH14872.1 restriction endonuclease subunit S [Streptomyces hygroscopicus]